MRQKKRGRSRREGREKEGRERHVLAMRRLGKRDRSNERREKGEERKKRALRDPRALTFESRVMCGSPGDGDVVSVFD